MSKDILLCLRDLKSGVPMELRPGGFIEKKLFIDRCGSSLNILNISNGLLTYTIILERGMDIGEIRLGKEKISWSRSEEYLLHPDNVDLYEEGGWEKGFYGAVAAVGPEIFGTPDEVRTVHGTGSYSEAAPDSVRILLGEERLCVEGTVPIRGYGSKPVYEKSIRYVTAYNSPLIVRKDTTANLTGVRQPLDDGYHIQLSGKFVTEGGRYVLPVARDKMLLRDSAPIEKNPLKIYDFNEKLDPIRCYQYVPEPVKGLEEYTGLNFYGELINDNAKITAEMLVNSQKDAAAFVIRPLDKFPRSLIAKRAIKEPMYALEPCRTRPNSLRQKAIDGELVYLEPYGSDASWIALGISRDASAILRLEELIEAAAGQK